ncbi:unnamed protein product, partial [Oncorhynchus mykiss]
MFRRKAERKWRKSKLQVHYDIQREQLGMHNEVSRTGSKPITKRETINQNNSRVLFSTIDGLISLTPPNLCELSSTSKYDEFAADFKDKITLGR